MTSLDTHLFAPLDVRELLEDKFNGLVKSHVEDMWLEMQDDLYCEQLIKDEELFDLFKKILHRMACAREAQLNCSIPDDSKRSDEQKSIRLQAYWKINSDIEQEIERLAQYKAEDEML